MPSVIRWNRLEPHARSLGLEGGLRAEVRYSLWMLARQWQFGEFWGEDAGSPVQIRLRMDCTPLTRYLPGGVPSSRYPTLGTTPTTVAQGQRIDLSVPLEVVVERERVRVEGAFQPRLAAEAGLHFLRVLAGSGMGAKAAAVTSTIPLEPLASATLLDSDTQRFLSVMAGRVPDGGLLASVLLVVAEPGTLSALLDPYKTSVANRARDWQTLLGTLTAADRDSMQKAVNTWLEWYSALFAERSGALPDPSWIPERLEYEFAVSAPTAQREVLLTAPDTPTVAWIGYSFDILPKGSLGAARADLTKGDLEREAVRRTAIPSPIRYPGMPNPRDWEFEDARVDFGAMATGAQQLAHLLLIEFALVSGDDWYVIPVDMPVGSLSTVRWLVVTDTFGDRTLVPSARQVDQAADEVQPVWDMFRLALDLRPVAGAPRAVPDAFLLPPVVGTSLHGGAIEEVRAIPRRDGEHGMGGGAGGGEPAGAEAGPRRGVSPGTAAATRREPTRAAG